MLKKLICIPALLTLACSTNNTPEESNEPADFKLAEQVGLVSSKELREISGLVCSDAYSNCLWVHNDKGNDPYLYLLNSAGEIITTLTIGNLELRDWEDIAYHDGIIYLGEIGDNDAEYEDKKVYKIVEPVVDTTLREQSTVVTQYDTMVFNFSDSQRDCETLMYDPLSDELVFITKRETKNILYSSPFVSSTAEDNITLDPITTLPTTYICGGDISRDGTEILIKDYSKIYYWKRSKDQSLAEIMQTTSVDIEYTVEPQGEAIGWSATGDCFYTVSEYDDGVTPVVYLYAKRD